MTQTNAAITNNVTKFTPPKDNLHEAIELLHEAQITGCYRYSALALAGPLISEVGAIFPLHMVLIFLTTSYQKRQVWLAYISSVYANPINPQPITDPSAVHHKLMHSSSKTLLVEAYGSIPDGFLSALKRLGTEGQKPEIYLLLHKFMSESAEHRKAFSHASVIKASTVSTLDKLPKPLQSFELADQIVDPNDIKVLTFIINTLAQGDEANYAKICSNIVKAAERKHSISGVLKRVYYQVKFPEPAVPDTEFCKHIGNTFELEKAAKQFQNCLGDYCEEGIRGEYVYYRIFENNRPVAIVSLREDVPFGFRIYEIKGKKNQFVDDDLEIKIIQHFKKMGVSNNSSMEKSLNDLSGMFKSDHRANDPVDHINDVIDELLDEGNHV